MNYDLYILPALLGSYAVVTLALLLWEYIGGYRIENGVILHYKTRMQIKELQKQIRTQQHTIHYLQANPTIKREKGGQLSFIESADKHLNGRNLTIPYPLTDPVTKQKIIVTCKRYFDRVKLTSGTHVWVEQVKPPVGKRTDGTLEYVWIEADKFDPARHVDVLEYFPYLNANCNRYIPERCLPFTWEYVEEQQETLA